MSDDRKFCTFKNGVARELIRGAYKLKDRLLLVLDTEKAVQVMG